MKVVSMDAPQPCPVMKPLTFALLRLLVDGKFHSGEMLAQHLGVSRASVSNALHGVDHYGLALHSVTGRGYCLNNPPQWLDAALIARHLGEQAEQFQIEILDSLPSSNTLLLQRAAQGSPSGSVLAVELQSGGRGRLGRSWHSGLGNALTFSLLWRFELELSALSGLSLAVGVALIRALNALGMANARLKWPNDVLNGNDGKLAGILLEAQGDMLGPSVVVIGIGLNLSKPAHLLPQINQSVSSLEELVAGMPGIKLPERNILFAVILSELQGVLHEFARNGFAALREEWESHHAWHNQSVGLRLPDGRNETGIARGVTESGALILEAAGAMQIVNAGEIGLRST